MAFDDRFLLAAAAWVGAAVALVGCQQAAHIVVEQSPSAIAFAVEGGTEPSCIISLTVRSADDRAAPPIWAISEGEDGACAARVDYGQTPPRYVQTSPARALSPNVSYDVTAVGVGFNVRERFTAR